MTYMLDTNIIIYAINHRPEFVLREFRKHDPKELCISAVTLAELEYGVWNSSRPEQNRLALITFLSAIDILPFDTNAAREYGEIRYLLKKSGTIIGANDLMIAAHAKANHLTLVTNNTKEFKRVPDLKLVNWAS